MKTMSRNDIEQELISLTAQFLTESGHPYKREIKLNDSLQRHLGIDSLGRAELFRRIEKHFDVSVTDKILAEAEALKDIVDYLETAKPSSARASEKRIIYSHGEYATVDPSPVNTLIETVQLYAEQAPNKPHIYFQNENGQEEIITYKQLYESALKVAWSLRELGLNEGETVAIMQPTQPGFFYTFIGVLLAGGIPVPIYPPFRMHMLEAYAKTEARILTNAGVRILVTFEQAEKLSHLLKAFVPSLKHITTVENLLQPNLLKNPFQAKSNNFAFIQYTSGSTADPKGVLLSHANLIANIRAYGKGIAVNPDDVAVSWLPLYHDMGLIAMWLGSMYFGIPLVLLTPFSFLNHPEKWLWAIHYHRGTLTGAPNFAYELCVRKIEPPMIEGLDLSSLRLSANGAEKVYPRTLEEFIKKFKPYGFAPTALLPVYGLAESTVGLSIPPLNQKYRVDYVERKAFEEDQKAIPVDNDKSALAFVSCGFPLEGHQIRIVDDQGNVLPERSVATLQFRGPSSMQGYYNNPRATAAIYHDGWWDSGDLAYMADGEVFITGRRKDLIIKSGRNIYPAEIEELVGAIKGVRQGCVVAFGVTDTNRGTEQLIVVAETRETDKAKRESLTEQINDAIASTLDIVPDEIVLAPPHAVPKTSSGKLQRAASKTKYLAGHLGKKQTPPWMQMSNLGLQWSMRKGIAGIKRIGKFFYTSYVALLVLLTLPPVYFMVLFASRSTATKITRAWAKLIQLMLFIPLKVEGKENLKQKEPVIYAANHASYIDSVIMLMVLPEDTRIIGKAWR